MTNFDSCQCHLSSLSDEIGKTIHVRCLTPNPIHCTLHTVLYGHSGRGVSLQRF